MRAAYVCLDPDLPIFGQSRCSIRVQEMLRALSRNGVHVELFAAHLGGACPPDLTTLGIHELPPSDWQDAATQGQSIIDAHRQVGRMLSVAGPFNLVYERHWVFSDSGMRFAQEENIPGVLEVNAPLMQPHSPHLGPGNVAAAESVVASAFSAASTVIAASNELASYLSRLPNVRDRVHVVANGVDPQRFAPSIRPARPKDFGKFSIGYVGTLDPMHGVGALIEAFAVAGHNDATLRLLIVGDGPERASLEKQVKHQKIIRRVEFVDAVSHDEVPQWITSLDVAVAPYSKLSQRYDSPLKIFEYMSTGRPVIASDHLTVGSSIEHNVDGLLCPPGDVRKMADAFLRLRRQPSLRRRLGQAARKTVLAHHTWATRVRQILNIALTQPSPPRA